MRALVATVVAATVVSGLVALPAVAAERCGVRDRVCMETAGDQRRGAIVTRGVNLPDLDLGSELGKAAKKNRGCDDCEWSLVPSCVAATADSFEIGCLGASSSCATPGDIRYRVYLRRAGGPWEVQGSVCLGANQRPDTVPDIGAAVRAEVAKYLPDANPTFQPSSGGIVNLPTIFQAGEPARITTEAFDVLGFQVVVKASARWAWRFDDNEVQEFTTPGGRYPDRSVSHTYTHPGPRQVSVTTFWRGEFTLNGEGPFPVPGPEISKTSDRITVPVREARAELVAG